MATGQCNCGEISFEISSEIETVYVCHCSICRRATGSNGIAVVVIKNADFRWLRGERLISHWQKPDSDWHGWFCRQCGSPVPGKNDALHMFVPAGLIATGGESLVVKHRIWVGSKAAWDEIGDSAKRHDEAYEGR